MSFGSFSEFYLATPPLRLLEGTKNEYVEQSIPTLHFNFHGLFQPMLQNLNEKKEESFRQVFENGIYIQLCLPFGMKFPRNSFPKRYFHESSWFLRPPLIEWQTDFRGKL